MSCNPNPAFAGSTVRITANSTIVMLGDSLTSSAYTYWQGLRDVADAAVSGLTWVNQGVSGAGVLDNTAELLASDASIAARVTPSNPHNLFIAVGVNDVKLGPWDAPTFRDRLIYLCTRALATCPHLAAARILISSLWFAWGEPTGIYEAEANQCMLAAIDAAAAVGCIYLDQRLARVRTGGQTTDGTHPTTAGKTNLSNRLITAVTLVP